MILDRSTLLSLAYCARWCPPPSCVDLLKKHLTHLHRRGSISLQRAVTAVVITVDPVLCRGDHASHEALLRRSPHEDRPSPPKWDVQVRGRSSVRRQPLLRQAVCEDS